jgi:hypothetical protein
MASPAESAWADAIIRIHPTAILNTGNIFTQKISDKIRCPHGIKRRHDKNETQNARRLLMEKSLTGMSV